MGELTGRLKIIFAIAVTADLALRQLNCERDIEVADCIRCGVYGPIADQVRILQQALAPRRVQGKRQRS